MTKLDLVNQYADFILNNLPEWNYSDAEENPQVLSQKNLFVRAISLIDKTQSTEVQLKHLGCLVAELVPDNHIEIFDDKNRQLVPKNEPKYSTLAHNLAYWSDEKLKSEKLLEVKHYKISGAPQWMLATKLSGKSAIGIVAIPSFSGDALKQAQARKQFVEDFFTAKQNQSWQSLIFDFRGNQGGDAELIKEIGERMCGKSLKYADYFEYITPKAQSPEQAQIISAQTHRRPETLQYISSAQDKFSGRIYVLQDRWCASASEGAIYMLSQMDNTTTIGEPTSGCFAGGACIRVPFEVGYLKIGTEYRRRSRAGSSINEKEGQFADIKVSSAQAYETALKEIAQSQLNGISRLSQSKLSR